ncbi:GIN domain-containing protein, partial [Chloroflexota bacterium]
GSANNIIANVSGASRFNLGGFIVNNANVTFSGASKGTVNLNGRLDANLSGASKLSYVGEPTMGTIKTSGGSSLGKN